MPDARVLALLRHTRTLAPPAADDRPDAELLARFLDRRDEAAFEALVRRHGPTVRAVCRAALANPADADDAFQATFLVLARRAEAIRDRAALGGWLYRVAYRVARKFRPAAGRVPLPDDLPARPAGDPAAADLRRAVGEEIARLPEKYRLVVQLCYVAGRSTADAAAALGWPRGTVLTRLAWARRRLRAGLERRGVTAAAGSLALLAAEATSSAVGPELIGDTARAAVAAAAGDGLAGLVSDRTVSLTEGVVRAMTVNKLKWAAGALLVAAALAGVGVGRWTANTASADPGDKKRPPAAAELDQPPDPKPADPVIGAAVGAAIAKPGPMIPPAEPDAAKPARRVHEFVVARPIGTWVREVDADTRITATFDEDRLTATAEFPDSGERVTLTIDADYSINKESVAFGVITGVECSATNQEPGAAWQQLVGQPFAFGFRADGEVLAVKDVRFAAVNRADGSNQLGGALAAIQGRYYATEKATVRPQKPKPAPRSRRAPPTNFDAPYLPPPGTVLPGQVQPAPSQPGYPALPGQPGAPVPNSGPPALPPADPHLTPERIHGGIMKATEPPKPSPGKKVYSAVIGPTAGGPPSDRDVLRALPTTACRKSDDVARDDIVIVKNRVADETDPPRFYPMIGPARLNRSRWECQVYYTETTRSESPYPTQTKKPRVEIVQLDQKQLVIDERPAK